MAMEYYEKKAEVLRQILGETKITLKEKPKIDLNIYLGDLQLKYGYGRHTLAGFIHDWINDGRLSAKIENGILIRKS